VESQDKALRRIAELKEQCQLEQKAKAHLEDALRNDLEERDHLINTLNTKIELLKLNGDKEQDCQGSQKMNPSENLLIDLSGGEPAIPVQNNQLQEEHSPFKETDTVLKGKCKL
jgi:1-pyrroline-5-carboxylate dehydrogenase